ASLENIPLLLEQGADIYAFDPVGANNFAKVYPEGKNKNGNITYVTNIEQALEDANVCFIFTEWGEVKALTPEMYKKLMRTPLVYDGRNIYDVQAMQEIGIEYHSIGRKATSRKRMRESDNIELQASR
ncbi:UDP binding domain-containing protein, partial [Bacillus cereus]|nr:UDP binding domain-containing protein [Bacillus cereus]